MDTKTCTENLYSFRGFVEAAKILSELFEISETERELAEGCKKWAFSMLQADLYRIPASCTESRMFSRQARTQEEQNQKLCAQAGIPDLRLRFLERLFLALEFANNESSSLAWPEDDSLTHYLHREGAKEELSEFKKTAISVGASPEIVEYYDRLIKSV